MISTPQVDTTIARIWALVAFLRARASRNEPSERERELIDRRVTSESAPDPWPTAKHVAANDRLAPPILPFWHQPTVPKSRHQLARESKGWRYFGGSELPKTTRRIAGISQMRQWDDRASPRPLFSFSHFRPPIPRLAPRVPMAATARSTCPVQAAARVNRAGWAAPSMTILWGRRRRKWRYRIQSRRRRWRGKRRWRRDGRLQRRRWRRGRRLWRLQQSDESNGASARTRHFPF